MVSHTENPVDDAQLTQALVDVLGHLCEHRYGKALLHFEEALRGSADGFVETLARHLLFEETVLFPELQRKGGATAEELNALQREHAQLRRLSGDLARFIHAGETNRAYDVARVFLAELYDHIGRESLVADRSAAGGAPPP